LWTFEAFFSDILVAVSIRRLKRAIFGGNKSRPFPDGVKVEWMFEAL
jgi:hypothetical protein